MALCLPPALRSLTLKRTVPEPCLGAGYVVNSTSTLFRWIDLEAIEAHSLIVTVDWISFWTAGMKYQLKKWRGGLGPVATPIPTPMDM